MTDITLPKTLRYPGVFSCNVNYQCCNGSSWDWADTDQENKGMVQVFHFYLGHFRSKLVKFVVKMLKINRSISG